MPIWRFQEVKLAIYQQGRLHPHNVGRGPRTPIISLNMYFIKWPNTLASRARAELWLVQAIMKHARAELLARLRLFSK
ncbi:hypothetical protein HanIR_Chr02g0051191 [Helianthus annuus]|nr:hypothetical protein HanIR_Chr02g0051191 [Helianthus annuus]